MDHSVCPGAKFLRQPRPEMFSCPDCGEEVEIWSDEIRGTCASCGKKVFREGVPSCVEWCKYGRDCVGEEAFGTYQRNRALGIKHRLPETMQRRGLLSPPEAEEHERAAGWAEAILEKEPGAWHLVIPAVLVHDVSFQEQSGERSLQRILLGQGLDPDDIKAVVSILEELSRRDGRSADINARIVRDAWILTELEMAAAPSPGTPRSGDLSTDTAKEMAREHLVAGSVGGNSAGRSPGRTEESDA